VQVLQYEEDQLPEKYPEYKHLIQEYHDGILLFDLTDQMVWSKAVEDSAGLETYYADNKNNYRKSDNQTRPKPNFHPYHERL
jgi:peptidyl-prolyl cis-trans isomerase SurA